jgi:putative multiple sugar transport system ATP-binding protein
MKVLSGVYPHGTYDGEIRYDGGAGASRHPRQRGKGIIIIHQELALVPLLSIAENMFLGQRGGARAASSTGREARQRTEELLRKVGLRERPTR